MKHTANICGRILGSACLVLTSVLFLSSALVSAKTSPQGERLGWINVPVTSVCEEPNFNSDRVTQALWGDQVKCVATRGSWSYVYVTDQFREKEGYPGWMPSERISYSFDGPAQTARVNKPRVCMRSRPEANAKSIYVLYWGTKVHIAACPNEDWYAVSLPGLTRDAYIKKSDLLQGDLPFEGQALLDSARQFMGVPYLWGGMTCQGIDCSGLTYGVMKMHGKLIPRDADQQFEMGTPVDSKDMRAGDLVFFGSSPDNVTHVGFFVSGNKILDSSGAHGVSYTTLRQNFLGARRF